MSDTSNPTASPFSRLIAFGFAATIFASAFLLFQVQPLISKYILPWFGGSPAVWSTCMLFFQVMLFAGYVYAHLTTTYLRPRLQALLHCGLLIAAACLLPITPDDSWKPIGADAPALRIVLLLTCSVGLPYFVLSSTGPLLQRWFSLQMPGASPYRLYALSNIGSLLALVSYPFVFEPVMGSQSQAQLWSGGFIAFAVLCGLCATGLIRVSDSVASTAADNDATQPLSVPSGSDRAMWFALAMVASVMLLATTNQVCLDVATVPFLWIVPLTIYLISFILCFDADRWYSRKWYIALLAASLLAVIRILMHGTNSSIVLQVMVYFAAFFFCCMVCHGELARQKPHPRYLTSFYLLISAGGAGGGLFVGLLAPSVFPDYWELHVGIVACLIATMAVLFRDKAGTLYRGQPRPAWLVMCAWASLLAYSLQVHAREKVQTALDVSRNFYGVLRVENELSTDAQLSRRGLFHGSILHGTQFLSESKSQWPTTYYGEKSAAGLALRLHRAGEARHIGVVGLGVGTLATYGQTQDRMRFYEINPDVIRLARDYFTFLSGSAAKSEMVLGDARLSLEHEPPQEFDILLLDAFSGDAIPTHLLTQEAADLYARHLKPDGLLCVHISNMHFDLRPIVAGLAERMQMQSLCIQATEDVERGTTMCHWVLLSRASIPTAISDVAEVVEGGPTRSLLWTDEWSNLLSVLK